MRTMRGAASITPLLFWHLDLPRAIMRGLAESIRLLKHLVILGCCRFVISVAREPHLLFD